MKSLINLTTFVVLSLLPLTMLSLTGCGSGGGDAAQVTAVAAGAQKSIDPGAAEKFVPDELLIQFVAGVSKEKENEVFRGHGASEVDEIRPIRVKRIKVPEHALDQVKEALSRNKHVKFVENNYLADVTAVPDDPSYPTQWHLPKISAPAGWDISTGAASSIIAIIDSGIDPAHPDLASKLLSGYNFLNGSSDTHDVQGHGTKVAGTAAAIGNNSIGIAGVAWSSSILPLVVVTSTGSASYSNIANAITYAADRGVRVISISIAGTSSSTTLENAVSYAWSRGALVFAGTGNSGTTVLSYPAACSKAIAVSATDSNDNRSSFSNYGTWITLAAPGSGIYTTTNGGGYASVSGTSFSTPMAAGVAGLILAANPTLTNQQVKDIMIQNVDDMGALGFDQYFGYGRINVAKSLQAAVSFVPQPDTLAPTVAIDLPAPGSTISGSVTVSTSANDNIGITKVELYVNGNLLATDTSQPFNFFWDTTTAANGSFQLTAKAYDAAGNTASATTLLTVNNVKDIIPPIVKILTPVDSTKIGTRVMEISASASDNISISRTEIYVDDVLQTTSTAPSINWSWNVKKATAGNHTIMVKAFDGAGNSAVASVIVTK